MMSQGYFIQFGENVYPYAEKPARAGLSVLTICCCCVGDARIPAVR